MRGKTAKRLRKAADMKNDRREYRTTLGRMTRVKRIDEAGNITIEPFHITGTTTLLDGPRKRYQLLKRRYKSLRAQGHTIRFGGQ